MSDFKKGDPVIITIGHRTYHGNFVKWLKGYRAKVFVSEMNQGPSDWTVNGLCLTKVVGQPKGKKPWPSGHGPTGSLDKRGWK